MNDPEMDTSRSLVSITSVDLKNMVFEGKAMIDRPKQIRMTILPGTAWVVPAVGEQWLVQRNGITWFLLAKTTFQDARGLLDQTEGMYAYGGKGETHIVGSKVSLHAPLFVQGREVRTPSQEAASLSVSGFTLSGEEPAIVPLQSTQAGSGMSAVTVGGVAESASRTYALDVSVSGQSKTVVVPEGVASNFSETFFVPEGELTPLSFVARPTVIANVSGLTVRITSL